MEVPEVQYARSGDAHIAFQVFGEGPDLVMAPGGFNHLLVRWELPAAARFFRRLASFCRVTHWDKRGTGLSDRQGRVLALEEQLDDLSAVMDAAGAERPVLWGTADGAFLSAIYAARRPERIGSLVLSSCAPRFRPGDDGLGVSQAFFAAVAGGDLDAVLELAAPSFAHDPVVRAWWRRFSISAASPGAVHELFETWTAADVAAALAEIVVPTTIVQRTGDLVCPPPNGRVTADLVAGSRYVEMEGEFSTWSLGSDGLLEIVEEAVTGARRGADPDRVLASILFTDIVASTSAAAALGDAAWRARLDEHDAVAARHVEQLGGRLVKSTGDGILATFDSSARAVRCAAELVEALAARGIEVRAGVHTGECDRRGDDLGGLAVHIAARVAAMATGGEVLVTGTVRDILAGSGLAFDDRGEHELRGVPGSWRVLALTSQERRGRG